MEKLIVFEKNLFDLDNLIKIKKWWESSIVKDKEKIKKVIIYLVNAKRYYSKLYSIGESTLTDNDYDTYIIDTLKNIDPDHESLKEVGAVPFSNHLEKVKLLQPCGSLVNIYYGDGSIEKWINNLNLFISKNKKYVISQKVDGITIYIIYVAGQFHKAYKRGDGIIGIDVTNHVKLMPSVPKSVKLIRTVPVFTVRGEAVMDESVFKLKYKKKEDDDKGYKTSRNMVAGMFNNKNPDPDVMKDIDLITYEIKKPLLNKTEQLLWLKMSDFKTVIYDTSDEINDDILKNFLIDFKSKSKYLMDGVVINVNDSSEVKRLGFETNSINPKYARAFKMRGEEYITTVVGVELNISKNGLLKPRIILKPVNIGGVTVTHANGKNCGLIERLGIGPGAIIVIIRSGDTIPDVLRVIKKAKAELPEYCRCKTTLKWVGRGGKRVDLMCPNENCAGRKYKKILAFFRGIGAEGFNTETAKRCLFYGCNSVDDIICMSIENFQKLDGFQLKKATNVYNSIHNALSSISLSKLMHASGFFGRSLGSLKLESIIKHFGEKETLELSSLSKDKIIEKIVNIHGFKETTAKLFANGIGKFSTWYNKNINYFSHQKKTISSDKFKNEIILFTGFRDKELKKYIEENGGAVIDNFNKKVTLVVAKDPNDESTKVKKAKASNIKIKNLEEFKKEN